MERILDVGHRRSWRYLEDVLVAEPDNDRFAAIEAAGVDLDLSAGE